METSRSGKPTGSRPVVHEEKAKVIQRQMQEQVKRDSVRLMAMLGCTSV